MKKTKWLAFTRGNRWVIAKVKVAQRNAALKILVLSEYEQDKEEPPVSKALQLRGWLKKKKVPLKKLDLAISCPGVITRMITLPMLSAKDLDSLLTEQVSQYFTVNIEDYLVDYRIVERLEEEGQKRLKVLVTALPKSQWEPMWKMWEEVGLEPKVVDLSSDCLARLYSRLNRKTSMKNAEVPLKDLAIVDINSDGVQFLLLEHGVFFLYSDLEAELTELSKIEGETKILQDSEQTVQTVQTVQTAQAEQAQLQLSQAFGPILRTLAEFLSFFAMRHFGKNVDGVYLTGELALLPNLVKLFETELGIPTHVGFIDNWKPSFGRKVKGVEGDGIKYGSLYGLALRED